MCSLRDPDMEARDSELVAEYMRQRLLELSTLDDDDLNFLVKKVEEERGENESGWGILPDLILEQIFKFLTPQQRYYASLTCVQWYQAINFCSTWEELTFHDTTFTRRRYDYGEKTYRHVLDHHRAQEYLSHVGHHLKRLTILPKSFPGLFAHYHFMNHMSTYAERYQRNPAERHSCQLNITSLKFVFFLDNSSSSAGSSESVLYGTGGDILGSVKRLISNLKDLKHLELVDLLLEAKEALHLLDEACSLLCEQLETLSLINCTKDHYSLIHPACFLNLQVLRMSPQNVGEEMMEILLNNYSIRELHLIQNTFTGISYPIPIKTWALLYHHLRVFLRTFSSIHKEMVWQEGAPVVSVIYDCPLTKFSGSSMITVVDLYSETVQEYGHLGLAKFRSSRKFVNRIDGPLLSLCRKCLNLNTLFVRDRISTSTALLIVSMTPNLVNFHIRRNGLIKKCDYMFHGDIYLDNNFTEWLKLNARDYDKTRAEICTIMSKNWKPLSDKEFKRICQHRAPY